MNFEIVTLSSYLSVANPTAKYFGKSPIVADIHQFADGELELSFGSDLNFQGKKVFVLLATYPPVHDAILKFAFLVHQVKMLGAQEIIGVIPYFGYARHDKELGNIAIIAKILEATGIKKLITFELHSSQILKQFLIPVVNLNVNDFIVSHIKKHIKINDDFCIISPDKGGQARCIDIAQKLGIAHISFIKERYAYNASKIMPENHSCSGSQAIVIDDMIDTGGTALNVLRELKKDGFKKIFGYFMHAVLSDNAQKKIEESSFEKLFISSSIPLQNESRKFEIFDISMLLANAIKTCITK